MGHSLGGIVAADVALLQKHRILGLINFDVPFLGLHPRVVPTGILSSMPKKDIPPEEKLADEQESLGMEPAYTKPVGAAPDPNFDRPWRNDIRLPNRGFLKGVMHFVNKNTDNLARSVFDRVVSSAKFAGCVNNYSELRRRYRSLMELEAENNNPKTIKFINYYTASTGRKKPKKEDSTKEGSSTPEIEDKEATNSDEKSTTPTPTPGLEGSLENLSIAEKTNSNKTEAASTESIESMEQSPASEPLSRSSSNSALAVMEAQPIPESEETETQPQTHEPSNTDSPIPTSPSPTLSPSSTLKEASLHLSESTSSTISPSDSNTPAGGGGSDQKLRKFILLPKNHWKYHDNAHWTPVVMQDIDEVEAHQSMFIPQGAHYDHLIGDTVGLIEEWVRDELSLRVVRESLD